MYIAYSSLATSTGGGRTRIISAAKQARKYGFRVHLLCFFPVQQLLRLRWLLGGRARLTSEGQCRVFYVPRLPLTRFGFIYSINDWYCGAVAALFCLLYRIQIIHGHGLTTVVFALIARRLKRSVKVVGDVHGSEMEEYLYSKNRAEPDRMSARLESVERSVLKRADAIIFVSHAMREYYQKRFRVNYEDASVIPCATDVALENLNGHRAALRHERGLEDKLVFCYAGSGEDYQLPGQMCELFKKILHRFPNAFFLIFSHHKDVFLKHLRHAGIEERHYKVDAVSHTEIFNVLQMADFGFLLRDNSVVNQVASPTKFGEYCLCGLPVIMTNSVGDFSDLAKRHKVGCVVDMRDPVLDSDLAAFIESVQAERTSYAERCSSFAKKNLSWDAYGAKLARIYSSLLSLNPRN